MCIVILFVCVCMGELWNMICPRGRCNVCTCKEFYLYEAVEDLGGPLREIIFPSCPLSRVNLSLYQRVFLQLGFRTQHFVVLSLKINQ